MNREQVIETLRSHASAPRQRGVRRAALFGSLARGEGTPSSDIDILVELEPGASIDLFDYVGITHYLADLFPVRVDVANKDTLNPHVRPSAESDAIQAF